MQLINAAMRALTAGTLIAFAICAAAQQPYPNKPIRMIVPYPPGGSTTPLAHLVGQKMTESWGQPVVVDNRPGGNTMIGTEAVAKSAHDGYTLMLAAGSLTLVPQLLAAPYDPIRDLAPIATFARTAFILLVNPSVPASNLKELIAYAKSKPGQLNYATPGAGGPQHLAHELLNLAAHIKTQHIPYKGSSQALTDLIGGQVQMYFSTAITAIAPVKAGRVKAIAISGDSRLPALPQVPTFAEARLQGLDSLGVWYGIIAPAGTPKVIIDKISAEIGKYMSVPDFKEKLLAQGLSLFYSNSQQFAALMEADTASYAKVIKAANIKFEN